MSVYKHNIPTEKPYGHWLLLYFKADAEAVHSQIEERAQFLCYL